MAVTDIKLIMSGNVLEIYRYEKPIAYDFKKRPNPILKVDESKFHINRENNQYELDFSMVQDLDTKYKEEEIKKRRVSSIMRTRQMVRRLINANFTTNDKFITLTFNNQQSIDIKNPKETHVLFDRFIKRMRRKFDNFKYLAVIEFQDKNGRGAVHYHMIANLPYIPKTSLHMNKNKEKSLEELWKYGFVQINDISNCDNIGAYITKYMTKDLDDNRLFNSKNYLYSRNLDKPLEIKDKKVVKQLIDMYNIGNLELVYENSYQSEYNGKIIYNEFNLRRKKIK